MKELVIPENIQSAKEKYKLLIKQLSGLLNSEDPLISNLSNLTAALKQTFDKISWVGFYIFEERKLYLGPFQGKVACTSIEPGKGVCGTSAVNKESIIVADVDKFPGHIVCDTDSKSEIVVPIINKDGSLYGVLDLDSTEYSAFNDIDKKYLEEISVFLIDNIIITN
ncbi:MAG: GAF domain-containing protein [Ignavibacteria bacterium]|nr:GAF domain-containing protein [Ignavibacteria bacterium]